MSESESKDCYISPPPRNKNIVIPSPPVIRRQKKTIVIDMVEIRFPKNDDSTVTEEHIADDSDGECDWARKIDFDKELESVKNVPHIAK